MLWANSGPGEVHIAFSFVPFCEPGPSVSETDGQGMCLYMFRGQARPTQQGSSSHQQSTSTSSSGHVQRHKPSLFPLPPNWHEVSDKIIDHRPQLSIRSSCKICLHVTVTVWYCGYWGEILVIIILIIDSLIKY